MTLINWHTIDHLQSGSVQQRAVYSVLLQHCLLDHLAAFDPVLVGTYPIDIAVPGSDLDIICEVPDANHFLDITHTHFGHYSPYVSYQTNIGNVPSSLARFVVDGYEVEVFGQPIPTRQQNGYRHMIQEARLLALLGPDFREKVIGSKRAGLKTEPAFAKLLHLPGDPYQALLTLEDRTDDAIRALYDPN
ncbi:DUF4269 domain-containing protein [Spirosoma aerophilum]